MRTGNIALPASGAAAQENPRFTKLQFAPSPSRAAGRQELATTRAPTDELGVRDGLLQLAGDQLLEVGDAAPAQGTLPELRLR